jgi:hypothetical protein
MRPLPVVVSALWWAVTTVAVFFYEASLALRLTDGASPFIRFGVLAVPLFVSFAILLSLWSYWQGYYWTRGFAIVILLAKVALNIRFLVHLHAFALDGAGILVLARLLDFLFSIYIAYWLMTKEAKRYFQL